MSSPWTPSAKCAALPRGYSTDGDAGDSHVSHLRGNRSPCQPQSVSSRGGVVVIVGIQIQKDSGAKGLATQTGSQGTPGDTTSGREAALTSALST